MLSYWKEKHFNLYVLSMYKSIELNPQLTKANAHKIAQIRAHICERFT